MKLHKLIVFIFSCFTLVNCCNDEDNSTQETPQNHAIHGSWNLTNVSGGFVGIDIDYTLGEVIYTFNDTNQQLHIENNILTTGPEDIYAGLDSGTYTYEIENNGETEMLYINQTLKGTILIFENTLSIDEDISADGFLYTFNR